VLRAPLIAYPLCVYPSNIWRKVEIVLHLITQFSLALFYVRIQRFLKYPQPLIPTQGGMKLPTRIWRKYIPKECVVLLTTPVLILNSFRIKERYLWGTCEQTEL
jgi:hypothetical protein